MVANAPILTPSTEGSPIFVEAKRAEMAFSTSSINSSGTMILRTAVHFCPALMVISFTVSLMNKSNSGVSGVACFPKMVAFKESASKLKETLSCAIRGDAFKSLPV